jgi:hypothetical protein
LNLSEEELDGFLINADQIRICIVWTSIERLSRVERRR